MLRALHGFGRRLGAIALLAMLVRAIVPAGYMLASADSGAGRYLTVVLCEGHEGPQQVIDLETGLAVDPSVLDQAEDGDTPDVEGPPCLFSAAAHLAQPAETAEPVEFVSVHQVVFGADRDIRPGRGIAAPPPPSTGPPILL